MNELTNHIAVVDEELDEVVELSGLFALRNMCVP